MLGITTWPYSVGDKKKLIYLEEWLYASSEGHLGFDTRKFEVYMTERNMYDSYKYLLGENLKITGWIYSKDLDCFLAPNGTMVSIKAINLKI